MLALTNNRETQRAEFDSRTDSTQLGAKKDTARESSSLDSSTEFQAIQTVDGTDSKPTLAQLMGIQKTCAPKVPQLFAVRHTPLSKALASTAAALVFITSFVPYLSLHLAVTPIRLGLCIFGVFSPKAATELLKDSFFKFVVGETQAKEIIKHMADPDAKVLNQRVALGLGALLDLGCGIPLSLFSAGVSAKTLSGKVYSHAFEKKVPFQPNRPANFRKISERSNNLLKEWAKDQPNGEKIVNDLINCYGTKSPVLFLTKLWQEALPNELHFLLKDVKIFDLSTINKENLKIPIDFFDFRNLQTIHFSCADPVENKNFVEFGGEGDISRNSEVLKGSQEFSPAIRGDIVEKNGNYFIFGRTGFEKITPQYGKLITTLFPNGIRRAHLKQESSGKDSFGNSMILSSLKSFQDKDPMQILEKISYFGPNCFVFKLYQTLSEGPTNIDIDLPKEPQEGLTGDLGIQLLESAIEKVIKNRTRQATFETSDGCKQESMAKLALELLGQGRYLADEIRAPQGSEIFEEGQKKEIMQVFNSPLENPSDLILSCSSRSQPSKMDILGSYSYSLKIGGKQQQKTLEIVDPSYTGDKKHVITFDEFFNNFETLSFAEKLPVM